MTVTGTIRDGTIVPDVKLDLPEGARVQISVTENGSSQHDAATAEESPLGKRLLKLAGRAKGLPSDAAINHDHYLYGVPKK